MQWSLKYSVLYGLAATTTGKKQRFIRHNIVTYFTLVSSTVFHVHTRRWPVNQTSEHVSPLSDFLTSDKPLYWRPKRLSCRPTQSESSLVIPHGPPSKTSRTPTYTRHVVLGHVTVGGAEVDATLLDRFGFSFLF